MSIGFWIRVGFGMGHPSIRKVRSFTFAPWSSSQASTWLSWIQWVENVGWHLEHAGWVWAEKGTVGYGSLGLLNNSIIGNFLFRRPAGKPVPSRADL
jgi:hypothetical protein